MVGQWLCSITAKFLYVVFIIYGIINHFEIVVLFIFFNPISICEAYLFTLLECLNSAFLSLLRVKFRTIHTCLNLILYISILLLYANHFWLYEIVLKFSGNIEENPRRKSGSNRSFSICHRNLNSISAHNYIKIPILRAYLSTHKFDVIYISELILSLIHLMITTI